MYRSSALWPPDAPPDIVAAALIIIMVRRCCYLYRQRPGFGIERIRILEVDIAAEVHVLIKLYAQFNAGERKRIAFQLKVEAFVEKLQKLYPKTEFVNRLMTHSWGQRLVRLFDPDGNLIEVGTLV